MLCSEVSIGHLYQSCELRQTNLHVRPGVPRIEQCVLKALLRQPRRGCVRNCGTRRCDLEHYREKV